jgi:hypothetical protein
MAIMMIIDYMDRVKLSLSRFGVRTSFMWVWMFGFLDFRVEFMFVELKSKIYH